MEASWLTQQSPRSLAKCHTESCKSSLLHGEPLRFDIAVKAIWFAVKRKCRPKYIYAQVVGIAFWIRHGLRSPASDPREFLE